MDESCCMGDLQDGRRKASLSSFWSVAKLDPALSLSQPHLPGQPGWAHCSAARARGRCRWAETRSGLVHEHPVTDGDGQAPPAFCVRTLFRLAPQASVPYITPQSRMIYLRATLTHLNERILTVPEAAYLTGTNERAVNHEIDAKIMRAESSKEGRGVSRADLVYLGAVRDIRDQISPKLRREIREAVGSAVNASEAVAKVGSLEVPVAAIEGAILANLETLERARRDYIESRPELLAGEPVLRGTRIAARLIADLLKQGTSPDLIAEEYDLTPEQVQAASIFDRVTPKRGRPRIRKIGVTQHVPAH